MQGSVGVGEASCTGSSVGGGSIGCMAVIGICTGGGWYENCWEVEPVDMICGDEDISAGKGDRWGRTMLDELAFNKLKTLLILYHRCWHAVWISFCFNRMGQGRQFYLK